MGARGPRRARAQITELRGNAGHRPAAPRAEAPPLEGLDGPEALRAWLQERGLWRPGSAELLERFEALSVAAKGDTSVSALVKASAEMRRLLRDLGTFDVAPVVSNDASPARILS